MENGRMRTVCGSWLKNRRNCRAVKSKFSRFGIILLALSFSTYARGDTGADIYKTKCAACHGVNGKGDTMLGKNMKLRPLASDEVQKESDDEIAVIISKGKNKMPAYEHKLSHDQIAAVIKYIRLLKK
jgi:cytochrome c6